MYEYIIYVCKSVPPEKCPLCQSVTRARANEDVQIKFLTFTILYGQKRIYIYLSGARKRTSFLTTHVKLE